MVTPSVKDALAAPHRVFKWNDAVIPVGPQQGETNVEIKVRDQQIDVTASLHCRATSKLDRLDCQFD